MSKINLFCFPYAGGTSEIYKRWKSFLHDSIILRPVELAGRGHRFGTPFYESIDETICDLYSLLRDDLLESPYAFFGHSMGNLIAYELYHKIKEMDNSRSVHIFFSGRRAPHLKLENCINSSMPFEQLKNQLIEMGGTPAEFFEYEELVDAYIPVLRADLKVVEQYKHIFRDEKIDCDISFLYGKDDDMNEEDISEWHKHTSKDCKGYSFEGGHFFIHNYYKEVCNIINNQLSMKSLC